MIMKQIDKSNSQLIAVCLFSKTTGEVKYDNYSKFYQQQEEQEILDRIAMEADY